MPKQETRYICQQCGHQSLRWAGKCPQCGEWNSLVETTIQSKGSSGAKVTKGAAIKPLKLSEIKSKSLQRINTGIEELNRVLGGGVVPGSLVLVAGEPGIGKSTLLTQVCLELTRTKNLEPITKGKDRKSLSSKPKVLGSILYVCGEESPAQIKIRINRLSPKTLKPASTAGGLSNSNNLSFLPETNIETIISVINSKTLNISNLPAGEAGSKTLVIVDSIQTLWSERLTGTAGSVGQVRECTSQLLQAAKETNIPIFLIGHVTKEGTVAGPKTLEHMVDTVLYLEGDKDHQFRLLRSNKNRFGPVDEVGVFQMTDRGMEEVKNPADVFLSSLDKKLAEEASGRAVVVTMQGLRPMLVEIQALVIPSRLAVPRRVGSGFDYKRLQLLTAVLQKRAGLRLADKDIFVNVAGGLKITEPAADLGVSLAVASALKNKPLPQKSVCLGELGLLGEIRKVSFMAKRIKEAKRMGYKQVIGEKERTLRQAMRCLK